MIYNHSATIDGRRTLCQFVRVVVVRGPGGTKGTGPVEAIVRTADGREHTVRRSSLEIYHDPNTVREYRGRLPSPEELEEQRTRQAKNPPKQKKLKK